MKAIILIILTSLCFSFWGMKFAGLNSALPKTLNETNWTSTFYHYHNNYFFDSDSTGFYEAGQFAWSCPIDTLALGISGDQILYDDPLRFTYQIIGDTLKLVYLDYESIDRIEKVFHYQSKSDIWISIYEFTYGNEVMRKSGRLELAQ